MNVQVVQVLNLHVPIASKEMPVCTSSFLTVFGLLVAGFGGRSDGVNVPIASLADYNWKTCPDAQGKLNAEEYLSFVPTKEMPYWSSGVICKERKAM